MNETGASSWSGGVPLRVLIADDEADARDRLRDHLASIPDVMVVAECGDTGAVRERLAATSPDVAFLDIRMPGEEVFSVLRGLDRERLPVLVFVTAHERHAVDAFTVSALDYLLKPFSPERLHTTLLRVREAVRRRRCAQLAAQLGELTNGGDGVPARAGASAGAPAYAERLAVRRDGIVVFVKTADIEWVDALGNTVRLNVRGASHLLRAQLGALAARLDPRQFVRIHRSTLVNVDKLKELHVTLQGRYVAVVESGRQLAISRTHRDALDRLLGETF